MRINHVDSINSNGGVITNDAITTGLFVTGGALTGAFGLVSTVHTFVNAPVFALATLGAGTGCVMGATFRAVDSMSDEQLGLHTVDVDATPVGA